MHGAPMVDANSAPEGIARIVFRQILEGDRRKFVAMSNDADTGGGARDLRFRSWSRLRDTLGELFPGRRAVMRRRGGVSVPDELFVGRFHWMAGGREASHEAVWETPTDARPEESRIARVHEYGCFANLPDNDGTGRLLVLFVQNHDGKVWPVFATEASLEKDDWHPQVAKFLLEALRQHRTSGNAAYGFVDFVKGTSFIR